MATRSISERFGIPHTYSPDLPPHVAVIEIAGALARILAGTIVFTIWGASTALICGAIASTFWARTAFGLTIPVLVAGEAGAMYVVSSAVRRVLAKTKVSPE